MKRDLIRMRKNLLENGGELFRTKNLFRPINLRTKRTLKITNIGDLDISFMKVHTDELTYSFLNDY